MSALLFLGACSHADERGVAQLESPSSDAPPRDDVATPFGVMGDDDEVEDEDDEELAAADDSKVISFEDEGDAGPTDQVTAPPKRKHIPSFESFRELRDQFSSRAEPTLLPGFHHST